MNKNAKLFVTGHRGIVGISKAYAAYLASR